MQQGAQIYLFYLFILVYKLIIHTITLYKANSLRHCMKQNLTVSLNHLTTLSVGLN